LKKKFRKIQQNVPRKAEKIVPRVIYTKFKQRIEKYDIKKNKAFYLNNFFYPFWQTKVTINETTKLFNDFLRKAYPEIAPLIGKFKPIFQKNKFILKEDAFSKKQFSFGFFKKCVLDFKKIINANGIPFMIFLNQLQLFVKRKRPLTPFKNKFILFYNLIIPLYYHKLSRRRLSILQNDPALHIGKYRTITHKRVNMKFSAAPGKYFSKPEEIMQFVAEHKRINYVYNYVRGRLIQFKHISLKEALLNQTLLKFRSNGNIGFFKKNRKLIMATTKLGKHIGYFLSKKKI